MFKDPFSKIPIKVKLPLGFILLYLCVMGVGGYFVVNSVYTPLNREILLRLQSEGITLATLFDKQLESLSRRAEDFSSDGFIRTQLEQLSQSSISTSGVPDNALQKLRQHLLVNKLPIVEEFVDLHIYNKAKEKILGLDETYPDIQGYADQSFHPRQQHVSAIIPPGDIHDFPTAAIITPLFNLQHDQHIGYLACVINVAFVIEQTSIQYDDTISEPFTEKYLTIVDQRGLTIEIPWWYLTKARQQNSSENLQERIGIKISTGQAPSLITASSQYTSTPGQEALRQSYPLRSTGWQTIIELNAVEAMHPLIVLEGRFLGIAIVLAIPVLVLLFLGIQHVVRPLGELKRMAFRIKEGDFSARNTIDSDDEIGTLAKTSNLMAEAIEERTISLEKTADDLQKRERELRIQHSLLNTVIHSMTDGLILMNFQGNILLSNKAADPLLDTLNGVDGQLQIQKCEFHRDASDQCVSCLCDPNRQTSCVLTVEGTIYEILSTKVPTAHGSSKVLVARNITEREHMHRHQAHQERLTVLGKLAAVVAHELNNPLAAISMYNQMMESELPETSPFTEHVDVIKRNTASCQTIIKDLLNYARSPQPQVKEIDLHELLSNVILFLRPFHQQESVEINLDFQASNPICWGDDTQLQQVFVNLMVNALQAAQHQEKGMIRLKTRGDDSTLVVEVEDNGVGIDEKHASEIFEPFFTTKSIGGTGLGLSTSKRIIAAHEGTLELLTSHPGHTIFRVSIPRNFRQETNGFIPVQMPDQFLT